MRPRQGICRCHNGWGRSELRDRCEALHRTDIHDPSVGLYIPKNMTLLLLVKLDGPVRLAAVAMSVEGSHNSLFLTT
jgi:hypothetical protein